MHWLIFNFVTVMLTTLILPSMIRYIILRRPVNKVASVLTVAVNVVLVVMLWIGLQSALLPYEGGGRTPTYLLLGISLGMFIGWAMLTKAGGRSD